MTAGGRWPDGPAAAGPLAGIRVLDLSQVLAGPFATMQLSDLGADVIKVERPNGGDVSRGFGPPFLADGTGTYFLAANRSKRSVALDLSDKRVASIVRHLAACADVVVDNWLPGRLARFGLDPAELRQQSPSLITATLSSFGSGNEYSGRPGFDFLAQAIGGAMAVTGFADGPPTRAGIPIADIAAGLYLAQGILAAIVQKAQTGLGSHVEVALVDAQVALLVNMAAYWLHDGIETARFGNTHPSIAPYETLRTADGEIVVAVGTNRQFRNLADSLGIPEMAEDERFSTNGARVRNRTALRAVLEEKLQTRATSDWMSLLVDLGIPVAPVNSLPAVFADPVIGSRMVGHAGGAIQVLSPLRIDGKRTEPTGPPPTLGQHTDEVLLGMGVDAAELARLRAEKVIL